MIDYKTSYSLPKTFRDTDTRDTSSITPAEYSLKHFFQIPHPRTKHQRISQLAFGDRTLLISRSKMAITTERSIHQSILHWMLSFDYINHPGATIFKHRDGWLTGSNLNIYHRQLSSRKCWEKPKCDVEDNKHIQNGINSKGICNCSREKIRSEAYLWIVEVQI